MQELENDHRGHTIFLHASGPAPGPWVASFSAWRIEPNNTYRAVIQGAASGVFDSVNSAHYAAFAEARARLDDLLGPA